MADYEVQFVRLSKYAPEEVATNELKRNKFERGLNLEIREKMAIKPPTYREVLETTMRAKEIRWKLRRREPLAHSLPLPPPVVVHLLEAPVFNGSALENEA